MYVISYDIDSDRIRNKIAKTLEDYGKRVQYSVFECDITNTQFDELYEKLAKLLTGEIEGSIRFYRLCATCVDKIAVLGCKSAEPEGIEEGLFII